MMKRTLIVVSLLALLAATPARADVGVVLNEALGAGGERIAGTGHSAVYFSRICAETPLKLRLCRAGEEGSVLSSYRSFHESEPFNWNIVPLGVFLYGAASPHQWPLVGTQNVKRALEEEYRAKYLSAACGDACAADPKADWRLMAGAGLLRNMYIFVVETTVAQDRELIEKFNALPNRNHFNVFTRNCADFTRFVINTYFPDAANPEYLNDFGMTSPKAIARSLTRYGKKHPELKFHVLHYPQVPGTISRSGQVREGTEQLYHSKLLVVPLAFFAGYVLPAALVSYELTGRFDPEHEWEAHPSPRESEISTEIQEAKSEKDEAKLVQLKAADRRERERVVGTKKIWNEYRRELRARIDQAVEAGILPEGEAPETIFKDLENNGTPHFDSHGDLWMDLPEASRISRVGLTPRNILAPESDPSLAYRLLLARTAQFLRAPKRSREPLVMFRKDWALLEMARRRVAVRPVRAQAALRGAVDEPVDGAGSPGGGNH